jgi:hypothetical protein
MNLIKMIWYSCRIDVNLGKGGKRALQFVYDETAPTKVKLKNAGNAINIGIAKGLDKGQISFSLQNFVQLPYFASKQLETRERERMCVYINNKYCIDS